MTTKPETDNFTSTLPPLPADSANKETWVTEARRLHHVTRLLEENIVNLVVKITSVAVDRGYCSEYDEIAEEVGLPARPGNSDDDDGGFCCDRHAKLYIQASLADHGLNNGVAVTSALHFYQAARTLYPDTGDSPGNGNRRVRHS